MLHIRMLIQVDVYYIKIIRSTEQGRHTTTKYKFIYYKHL